MAFATDFLKNKGRVMDRLVTLFGGGGFLGRYVAQALYRTGVRVRIAQPHPERAYFLKPLGALGQTQFVRVDVRDAEAVAKAVAGSDAVINLVGTFGSAMQAIHVEGARNIAEAAATAGVTSLVHISAIGADPDSASAYGRTKGDGEAAVRAAFPTATIFRPSVVFGREDNFVNRFAGLARMLPLVPVLRGSAKFQPVYAGDAGRAIAAAALDAGSHGGQTYYLAGPEVLTMRQFNEWIGEATGHRRGLVDVPDAIGGALARFGGWLPGAPITWDQWLMLQSDNVAAADARGLDAFGITPTPLSAVAEGWLTSYRRNGRFAAKSPY